MWVISSCCPLSCYSLGGKKALLVVLCDSVTSANWVPTGPHKGPRRPAYGRRRDGIWLPS